MVTSGPLARRRRGLGLAHDGRDGLAHPRVVLRLVQQPGTAVNGDFRTTRTAEHRTTLKLGNGGRPIG